ncbi:MAG TPA: caspase family protein, partial [Isosphaeraceae bacterium]|nr:caspase family protein [Isosphaeraceae bacterium]
SLTLGDLRLKKVGSLTLGDLRIEKGSLAVILIKRGDEVVKEIDTKPLGGEWRSAAWVDRDRIIVGTLGGDVALVDANTGKLKRRFVGHYGSVWAVAPSPDRRFLLTASQDSTLRVWSLDDSSPILVLYFTDDGEWIASARKGYYAASTGGERLMGWGVDNGLKAMASFYPSSQFRKMLYRPDVIKRLIDVGSTDQALAAADAAAGKSTKLTDIEQILPPTISITKPASSPVKMTVKTLEIEAVARSYGANPVTEMRLMLDDRPVPDAFKSFDSPNLWEASATFTVEVPPGNHRLTVQASNAASKAVSDPVEVVGVGGGEDGAQRSGTLYVLAIGINDYPDKRLKLDCAAPDAQALRQVFLTHSRRLFRDVEARLLLDRQATRAEMLGGMQWLGGKVKAGDVAVVFYAGHGYCSKEGVFYLVPADANLRHLSATGISGEALKKSIGELPCTTVLILDACYAASIGAKKRKTRALPVESDTVLRHLIYDSGLVVMCAAYKDQEAAEENGHGFFTQAIIEGLEGKADKYKTGRVEVDDLQTYVKHRVRELSDNEQEPTIGIPPTVRSFALSQP